MNDVLRKMKNRQSSNANKPQNQAKWQTFFCISMSYVWRGKKSLPKTLMQLRNKHGIRWLRISMSYHRFCNLLEILQGDLTAKLNENITSRDFADRPCNCCAKLCNINGECIYKGNCRKSLVVYKATCTDGKYYIGSTQQHVKARMNGHFGNVRDLINHNTPADSFAIYCADKLTTEEGNRRVKAGDARQVVKSVEIL